MLENFEKEYKKTIKEWKFNKFYITISIILLTLELILSNLFPILIPYRYLFVYSILIISVIIYLIIDYTKAKEPAKIKKVDKFIDKLIKYRDYNKNAQLNNLLSILKKYKLTAKSDIKFVIDYYNIKRPAKIESSPLAWFISTVLTLSSFVGIAYNSETHELDIQMAFEIISPILGYVTALIIPIIIIKIGINCLFFTKSRVYNMMCDDLSSIYLNYTIYTKELKH